MQKAKDTARKRGKANFEDPIKSAANAALPRRLCQQPANLDWLHFAEPIDKFSASVCLVLSQEEKKAVQKAQFMVHPLCPATLSEWALSSHDQVG